MHVSLMLKTKECGLLRGFTHVKSGVCCFLA
jgi:hypothetical protein